MVALPLWLNLLLLVVFAGAGVLQSRRLDPPHLQRGDVDPAAGKPVRPQAVDDLR